MLVFGQDGFDRPSDCRKNDFGNKPVVGIRNSNRPELVRFQFVFFLGEEEQIPPIKGLLNLFLGLVAYLIRLSKRGPTMSARF